MTTVSLAEAQARLPELVAAVGRGEKVVLTVDDRPVAKLESAGAEIIDDDRTPREVALGLGALQGKIHMSEDFNAPLNEYMEPM